MQEVAALVTENANLRASEAHLRTAAAAARAATCKGTAAEAGRHTAACNIVPLQDTAALHEAAVNECVAAARQHASAAQAGSGKASTTTAKV
jgi:hypothetical protein